MSFQTTNKTTGKHWIVHTPSFQIRGFMETTARKLKKTHNTIRPPKTWSTCTYWQAKPLLCLTRMTFSNVEKWRGKLWRNYINYRRGKTSFHREIDGHSVPIGPWFPDSCSSCTQVRKMVEINFMPHSPTKSASLKTCRHSTDTTPTPMWTMGHWTKWPLLLLW